MITPGNAGDTLTEDSPQEARYPAAGAGEGGWALGLRFRFVRAPQAVRMPRSARCRRAVFRAGTLAIRLGARPFTAIEERPFPAYNAPIPRPPAGSLRQPLHMTDDSDSPSGAITQWLLDWGR